MTTFWFIVPSGGLRKMAKVFQYGSNTCTSRLNGPKRLKGDAIPLGKALTVENFDIAFDVYSSLNECAASDIVRKEGRKVWGVLYDIPTNLVLGRRDDRKTLATIEGSNYEDKRIQVVTPEGDETEAITFVVKEESRRDDLATSAKYVYWIVSGLKEYEVPVEYINHVIDVAIETNHRVGGDVQELRDFKSKD
jgi:hypothetical protein